MAEKRFYLLFHLNLAFSSIPESDHERVIRDCYRPILRLAADGLPVGIEASGSTLSEIERIDATFTEELKALLDSGKCEFIGSGFSQIVMPLTPVEVNRWNLSLGGESYERILGDKPVTALVNEQTFSAGLVDLYAEAGYRTIITDWSNSYKYNAYPKDYLYYPQKTRGLEREVTLLWSHSIAFQRFQRYIHGEIRRDDYLEFLDTHLAGDDALVFPIYGNDAEVFDYRPGRALEAQGKDEWERIREFLFFLQSREGLRITLPRLIIDEFLVNPTDSALNELTLTSPETPLPTKKQAKYNPTRWAVTGRDSVHINTQCYRALRGINSLAKEGGNIDQKTLRELRRSLCLLWGSDFRTNTTDEKLAQFRNNMGWLLVEIERLGGAAVRPGRTPAKESTEIFAPSGALSITGKTLTVKTARATVELLCDKGLSLKSLIFPRYYKGILIGTLAHGFYEDIDYGADFFSGHMINIQRDGRKITDLAEVNARAFDEGEWIRVSAEIVLPIGVLEKSYRIYKELERIDLNYRLKVEGLAASSLRLGIFTFSPDAFDPETLWYECVNGGDFAERFQLKGRSVAHGDPVSATVSASSCLGATAGFVDIGDDSKGLRIETDRAELFSAPFLHFNSSVDDSYFMRLYHSIGEIDDTAYWVWRGYNSISFSIRPLTFKKGFG